MFGAEGEERARASWSKHSAEIKDASRRHAALQNEKIRGEGRQRESRKRIRRYSIPLYNRGTHLRPETTREMSVHEKGREALIVR